MNPKIIIGPLDFVGKIRVENPFVLNPGLGGSDLRDLQIAKTLRDAGLGVTLILQQGSLLELDGVGSIFIESLDNFEFEESALITRSSALSKVQKFSSLARLPKIVVSHHPHDLHLRLSNRDETVLAVVNVGEYQFWSNWRSFSKNILLRGFAPKPTLGVRSIEPKPLNYLVGHMSSLHPSKGFEEVLRGWMKLSTSQPKIQFQVIGGLSLYGEENLDEGIPTSKEYASKLKRLMRKHDEAFERKVSFLGVSQNGGDGLIANWDIAALNPMGIGESDPLSFHEILSQGIPIVSGGLFGTWEIMQSFPELRAATPRGQSRKINKYFRDEDLRLTLRSRALEVAQRNFLRCDQIASDWVSVASGASRSRRFAHHAYRAKFSLKLVAPLIVGFTFELLAPAAVTTKKLVGRGLRIFR
jgi:glycosyltransferase involved in cell wall biosynthesis